MIAIKAGEKILEVYNDEDSFQVEAKSDKSPLTRADRLANERRFYWGDDRSAVDRHVERPCAHAMGQATSF